MSLNSGKSGNTPPIVSIGEYQMDDVAARQDSPGFSESQDFTSFHPDQQDWSWDNLPDILYQLKPTVPKSKVEPPIMTYRINGEFLRVIPVLPDHIASDVDEFRVEAWMRLDRRIKLSDIVDRMDPKFKIAPNALQQRGGRFRQAFRMLAWDSGNKLSRELEATLLKELMTHNIDLGKNTTRGLTPGFINPVLGEAGGRIPLPVTYSPERRKKRKRLPRAPKPKTVGKKQEQILVKTAQEALRVFQRVGPAPSQASFESQKPVSSTHGATEVQIHGNVEVRMNDVQMHDATEDSPLDQQEWPSPEEELQATEGFLRIPDNELPEFVSLADIDLSQGFKKPQRRPLNRCLETAQQQQIERERIAMGLKASSSGDQTLCGQLSGDCFFQGPVSVQYTPAPISQPTANLYLMKKPIFLDRLPAYSHNNIFDHCLKEYYNEERYLFQMPYLHS